MSRQLFSKMFWADAFERAVKTAAQTALTFLTIGAAPEVDLSVPWQTVVASAGLGAIYSVLTSLASAPRDGISPASVVPPGV